MPQNVLPLLKKVAETGLLVSLHPYDTPVRAFSYEYRNKLLAKLGVGVLVLGAAQKSGALITAKHAKAVPVPAVATVRMVAAAITAVPMITLVAHDGNIPA